MEYQGGLMEIGDTRVMSPNHQMMQVQVPRFGEVTCVCPVCSQTVNQPTMCANCGTYGHYLCLGIQPFQGYEFCSVCMPNVVHAYQEFQDSEQVLEWQLGVVRQLKTWKQCAVEAMNVSASIGVAVGGAVATATGVAVAGVQGLLQGAQNVMSERPHQRALPSASTAEASGGSRRRALSHEVLPCSDVQLTCPVCDHGNKHRGHNFDAPSCKGLPRSVYFRPRATTPPIADVPAQGDTPPPTPTSSARPLSLPQQEEQPSTSFEVVPSESPQVPTASTPSRRYWPEADQSQFSHLPPLPENWIRVKSRNHGSVYYFNPVTNQSTFEFPVLALPEAQEREMSMDRWLLAQPAEQIKASLIGSRIRRRSRDSRLSQGAMTPPESFGTVTSQAEQAATQTLVTQNPTQSQELVDLPSLDGGVEAPTLSTLCAFLQAQRVILERRETLTLDALDEIRRAVKELQDSATTSADLQHRSDRAQGHIDASLRRLESRVLAVEDRLDSVEHTVEGLQWQDQMVWPQPDDEAALNAVHHDLSPRASTVSPVGGQGRDGETLSPRASTVTPVGGQGREGETQGNEQLSTVPPRAPDLATLVAQQQSLRESPEGLAGLQGTPARASDASMSALGASGLVVAPQVAQFTGWPESTLRSPSLTDSNLFSFLGRSQPSLMAPPSFSLGHKG